MYIGLIAAAAAMPFMDLEVFQVAGKSIVLPYLVSFVLAIPLLKRPALLGHVLRDPTVPFFLAWLLVAGFSSLLGYLQYHREPFLRYQQSELVRHDVTQLLNLMMMFAQYCLYVCALRTLSLERLDRVFKVFVLVGVFGSLYALYQMGFVFFGLPYRELFRTSNLYLRAETLEPNGFGGWVRLPRAFGTAPEPSLWGAYLTTVFGFLIVRAERRGYASWVAVAVVLAAVFVTFSRSTWMAVAVVAIVWIVGLPAKKLPKSLASLAIVAAVATTLWPTLLVGGSTRVFTDLSALERMSAQLTGLNILYHNPLFGIGFGSIPFFIERYAILLPGYQQVRFITVFSFFLLVFVSTGLLGGSVFLAFLGRLSAQIHRSFKMRVVGDARTLRLGSTLAFIGIMTSWLNHPSYNFSYIWFCLALASVLPNRLMAAQHAGDPAVATCKSET